MASPFDPWRNTYGMPGPQDPNRPGEIRASAAPMWEELFRGSDVTAINSNPLVQALQRYTNRAPTGISETTRVSPIDSRPVPPEPGAMDKLPPTVQEGIGGLGLLANFLAPGVKLPAVAPKPTGIRAYHGSPHDFDKFDMSKIGTGEGAQAYGHGLYFAESEGVAKMYRDQLSATRNLNVGEKKFDTLSPLAQQYAEMVAAGHDMGEARSRLVKTLERARSSPDPYGYMRRDIDSAERSIAAIDEIGVGTKVTKNPGRMYEVNIKADPEQFLDWDKPLSGQSEAVRKAIGERLKVLGDDAPGEMAFWGAADPMRVFPSKDARSAASAQALREAGIPGIRYKDAMSRGADGGTSNYVVFNDALIEILRKYGLLPPAIAAGAALSEQEPPL
jgi:hypothetical protein